MRSARPGNLKSAGEIRAEHGIDRLQYESLTDERISL